MSARVEPLTRTDDLDEVFARPRVLIYKHSARCWMCKKALKDVRDFAGVNPDVAVYMVDVMGNRDVSDEIARRFDLKHESPQVILVEASGAVWHANHMKITPAALSSAAEGA
jgi:bacillithiol system protein YtxJ